MDFMVGNVDTELNGNINSSNVTEKLDQICGLCCRQFFPDSLFGDDESQGFSAEKVLRAFMAESETDSQGENNEYSKTQMCFNCKTHFKNLMIQKEILSRLIDDMLTFLQQNSPLTALTNSKERIVCKLFQIGEFPYLVYNSCSINNLPIINQFDHQISELDPQDLEHQLNSIVVTFVPEQQFVPTGLENFSTVILVNPESKNTNVQVDQAFNPEIKEDYPRTETSINVRESIVNHQPVQSINYEGGDTFPELVDLCDSNVDDFNLSNVTQPTSNLSDSDANIMRNLTNSERKTVSPPRDEVRTKKKPTKKKNLKNPTLFCSICTKKFNSKSDLTSHIVSHTEERRFTCEICGVGYRHKLALETHLALHRGEAKFECENCHKMFTQKSGLKRHLTIHTGEKAYQCEICQKQFRYHTSFNIHKLTHKGTKEHVCVSCSQSFISKSHLRRHEKVHIGHKPYKCEICSKDFTEKYNLDAHKKIHSGIAVHSCKHCHEQFKRKRKLEDHITKSHTEVWQAKCNDKSNLHIQN